jgi:hypothetical protein
MFRSVLAMKRFRIVYSVVLWTSVMLATSFCHMFGDSAKIVKAIRNNAAMAIEFFPSSEFHPSPGSKPPRIHYNFKYESDAGTLVTLVDDWRFREGRRSNQLRVYHIALSEIDLQSAEIEMEDMRVGPISYKGGKTEIEPCRLVLWSREGGQGIKLETYDRGRGKASGRWDVPSAGAEVSYVEYVEIFAPNEQRARNIIDVLNECL